MKQHLSGKQLKEISYDNRIKLLSLVTGLTREYLGDEYKRDTKHEDELLLKYGYDVKVGELIEIIQDYTGQFPTPNLNNQQYEVVVSLKNNKGEVIEAKSELQESYCDALYDIVKFLLNNDYIDLP
ncbi:hypothetical protein [Clostridium folliculivorans]|uniref:Uncharacterized protein n=1 Tax=Clostridium folliculivorans TaxID=2886038 RepID=A0A9W5Y4S3_9CLOT|nr:hypothetical protein [Clostridium folliculivorans]GKU26709.1 hypothetical protein CFOLD11_35360 [Clostridium folliculivorans]GKU28859.1 hypothetical protein CFB3_09650 [Clostridium folliculivorans]